MTGPLLPLRAADALVVTRETVYNIVAKHGMRATLAPRIFSDTCMSFIYSVDSVLIFS